MQHVPSHDFGVDTISNSDAGRLLEGKNAPAVAALMWDCGCSCQLLADQLLAEWPAALCGAGRGPQTSAFNVCVLDFAVDNALDNGFAVDFFD